MFIVGKRLVGLRLGYSFIKVQKFNFEMCIRDRLKTEREGNIWICVGASVAGQLLKEGRIDKLWLSVIPTVLGLSLIHILINNALNMLSVETYFQQVATGALIIGAVTRCV